MPADPFQLALEHHRGGRLSAAEAGYRAVLRDDPVHVDATHWLGVLLLHAGQAEQAVQLLITAAANRPEDAAFQHNLGQALLMAGHVSDAIAALERADKLDPGRPQTLTALARAYIVRRGDGDARLAVAVLERAVTGVAGGASAELHHDLGVARLAAGQVDDAIAALATAAKLKPDYASASYHLALAHHEKGEPREVRRYLHRVIEADPSHARAWHALAMLDVAAGNPAVAVPLFRKAIMAKPDFAAAYEGLAGALEKLGRTDEAKAAREQADRAAKWQAARAAQPTATVPMSVADLERRLTPAGDMAQLHEALAATTGLPAPSRPAAAGVANLFDRYADTFDEHLRQRLGYRPELIAEAVQRFKPHRPLDVLDLGCGTGLCGVLLRPMAATLTGVDLSPAILEKARERGIYDSLAVQDLVEALRSAPRGYDLLTAGDVLTYLGDLAPTFETAAAALRPGGLFVFTVEAGRGERFEFNRATKRYQHARGYLEHLAKICGFGVRTVDDIVIREDAGKPIAGYLVVLELQ